MAMCVYDVHHDASDLYHLNQGQAEPLADIFIHSTTMHQACRGHVLDASHKTWLEGLVGVPVNIRELVEACSLEPESQIVCIASACMGGSIWCHFA